MPDERWLPLADASRVLGLQPDTLRKQAKRGRRDARRDNHGRWQVLVRPDDAARKPERAAWDDPAAGRTEPDAALVAELRARIADLQHALDVERRRVDELLERRRWPGLRAWLRWLWTGD